MRHHTELPSRNRNDWKTISALVPYLWDYRYRLGLALFLLILGKLSSIGVPLLLKVLVDSLDQMTELEGIVSVPLFLLIAYGLLRLGAVLFKELQNLVFAKASQNTIRRIALTVFEHLHQLSLRFHLDRQTGGLSRDLERGTRSISSLLHFLVFSILPTFFELAVVSIILLINYDIWFTIITLTTVVAYFLFTWHVTNWRTKYRIAMNAKDSDANTSAIDSLINYETVKYFGNEAFEAGQYDEHMQAWEKAAITSQTTLSLLNIGQGLIVAIGLASIMILASARVLDGTMTLGDFVLVNAFLMQLYIPLNFLGTVFREVRHCLTDMERMFNLLHELPDVKETPDAPSLLIQNTVIEFRDVDFHYQAERPILKNINFRVEPGQTIAIVGTSGSGKSTIARLLFRFYDPTSGAIYIDEQNIRKVRQSSLRSAIGVVPQDTVLFNNSIAYNISYGDPTASENAVMEAAQLAHLASFIESLPEGYRTPVGERGLKLSGGEKQRVAIARTILKNPPILVLDEATSALDSRSEKSIQRALHEISENRTAIIIAHRLSTIVHADQILVLEEGKIVERGRHLDLLESGGIYTDMWRLQQEQERNRQILQTEDIVSSDPVI